MVRKLSICPPQVFIFLGNGGFNTVIRVDNDVSKDEKRYVPLLEVAYPPPPFFLPV